MLHHCMHACTIAFGLECRPAIGSRVCESRQGDGVRGDTHVRVCKQAAAALLAYGIHHPALFWAATNTSPLGVRAPAGAEVRDDGTVAVRCCLRTGSDMPVPPRRRHMPAHCGKHTPHSQTLRHTHCASRHASSSSQLTADSCSSQNQQIMQGGMSNRKQP